MAQPEGPGSPAKLPPEYPPGYPHQFTSEIHLKDGTRVTVRPIRPDDAPRLQVTFSRLSSESVYLRFLETLKELTIERARELATVDYSARMALVAEFQEAGDTHVIGVARYAAIGPQRPGAAECAITVIDAFQGRGLATALIQRLVEYARSQGLKSFIGNIHHTNAPILRFIKKGGLQAHRVMTEPGMWEITIDIDE